jgi:hypothetical protein
MRDAAGRRATGGAVTLVLASAILGPAPAIAAARADDALILPGTAHAALVGDIEGDGTREVVRVIDDPDGARVEAWGYADDGWVAVGSAPLRHASDSGEPSPINANRDAVALMAWHVGGSERVLAIVARASLAPPFPTVLGLTISEIRRTDGGLALEPLPGDGLISASFIQAADFDADATDELVLTEWAPDGTQRLQIVRWSGAALEVVFDREDPPGSRGALAGESDGEPGDDLLIGPTPDGRFERIAWVDDGLTAEASELGLGRRRSFDGWVVGATDGAIVLLTNTAVRVARWPRQEGVTQVAELPSGGFPSAYLIGHGRDAVLAVFDASAVFEGRETLTNLYDLALRPLGTVLSPPVEVALSTVAGGERQPLFTLDRPIFPYLGPLPNGWIDGRPGLAANGLLILPDGRGGFERQTTSSLAGLHPVGIAGPEGRWMALLEGLASVTPGQAYLSPGPWAPNGRVIIARVEDLLGADDWRAVATVELHGAVETGPALDGVRPLLADGDGFELQVTAPPGSSAIIANGWRTEEVRESDGLFTVEIAPPRPGRRDRNQPLAVTLVVVTPVGRVSTVRWEGFFVRELPTLDLGAATTQPFALRARIEGHASAGTTVTIGGAPAGNDADGSVDLVVDAPIWPSSVVVVARDPLGNEAREIVEVVGFVDYRSLPWQAFVVVATLVAGAVLYIRVPNRPQSVSARLTGDAHLEEMDLDAPDADALGRVH